MQILNTLTVLALVVLSFALIVAVPVLYDSSEDSGRSNRLILLGGIAWVALVLVNWGVKPCDRNQAVRVSFTLINYTTKAFIYTDSNAPANGRVDLLVPSRQLYQGIVTVFDAVTGEVVGTRSITVSTVPKGGV